MDTVPNPILGRSEIARIIEYFLKMDDRYVVFLGKFIDNCLAHCQFGPIFFPVYVLSPGWKPERLAKHKLYIRQGGNGFTQQLVILLLELLSGDAGVQIINADKDAEDIGFYVIYIFIPTGPKVRDFVSAYAAIDKGQVQLWHTAGVFACNDILVAVAEDMIEVIISSAIAICYGVALEQNP